MRVSPSGAFRVGERTGPPGAVASWIWTSAITTNADTAPLFDEFLRLFGKRAAAIRSCLDPESTAELSVVGYARGIVVASPEEAERRRIDWGEGEFRPFFDGDRVAASLSREVVALLAAIGASAGTHIDFKLVDEYPDWWDPHWDQPT